MQVGLSFAGILILLFLAVAVGLLIAAVLLSRRAGAADGESTCGKCGYGVRGLAELRCPECGSDLREVGIVAGGTRRTLSPFFVSGLWIIALTMVMIVPMGMTARWVQSRVPMTMVQQRSATLGLAQPTGGVQQFDVVWQGSGPATGAVAYETLEVVMIDTQGKELGTIEVDLQQPTTTVNGTPRKGTQRLGPLDVVAVLPEELDGDAKAEIARDLVAIVHGPNAPNSLSTSGRSFSTVMATTSSNIQMGSAGVLPYLAFGGWSVVWLAMFAFFLVRALRHHRVRQGSAGAGS